MQTHPHAPYAHSSGLAYASVRLTSVPWSLSGLLTPNRKNTEMKRTVASMVIIGKFDSVKTPACLS